MESEFIRIKGYGFTADITLKGAELRSLTDAHGTQYIWQRDEHYWCRSSPILFPYIGVLRDSVAVFPTGQRSKGAVHGFARDSVFSLLRSSGSSVSLFLSWSEASLRLYPYRFRLEVEYSLSARGLTTKLTVYNDDVGYMLFGLGGHPGFCCPLHSGEKYSDYVLRFPESETQRCPYFNDAGMYVAGLSRSVLENERILTLEHERFEHDALVFSYLNSSYAELINLRTGAGISFGWEGFPHLGVWTPKGKNAPLVSLEPWTSMPAGTDEDWLFEKKRDIVTLAPDDSFVASYTIFPLRTENRK